MPMPPSAQSSGQVRLPGVSPQPQQPQMAQQQPQQLATAPTAISAAMPGVDANGQYANYGYPNGPSSSAPQQAQMAFDPNTGQPLMPGMNPNVGHGMPYDGQQQYDAYGQPMMAMGTPGSVPMMSGLANPSQNMPAKTLLGAPGIGNYGYPTNPAPAGGYRPITQPGMQAPMGPASTSPPPMGNPSGQTGQAPGYGQNMSNPNMYGYQYDQYGQLVPQNPSQPQMQGYPMAYPSNQDMQGMQGYPQIQNDQMPTGRGQAMAMPMPAEEIPAPLAEGKKSTMVRDIVIGVVIAVVVLAAILAVKMFVLDTPDEDNDPASGNTTLASVKIKLPAGVKAKVFVDDKTSPEYAAVTNDSGPLSITAGKRTIRIEAEQGKCEKKDVELVANETTELDCPIGASGGGAGSGASGANSAGGSGQASTNGSAAASTTNTASTGSAGASTATVAATGSATAATTTTTSGAGSNTTTATTGTTGTTGNTTVAANTTTTTKSNNTTIKPVESIKPADSTKTTTTKTTTTTTTTAEIKPAEDNKGYLVLACKPPAKVLVDNVATGLTTPVSGHALPVAPGSHRVTFEIGRDKYSFRVMVKAGEPTALTKDFGS